MASSASLLALLLLATSASANIDISQINANNLQEQLPSNFTLDDAKPLLRDKCMKVANEEAYKQIETGTEALSDCLQSIVNVSAIQTEIEEASPRGELDVVFNKYCLKRPQALACLEAFNGKLAVCLDSEEKESLEVLMRIVRSLLNFICHKGGDQIALFIAEKGPECLDAKKDDIQQCLNNTFGSYMPKEGLDSVKSLPKLVMGQKQCDEMARLEKCVVERLETCDEITPANIVESMFRFIKNETICHNATPVAVVAKQQGKNAAPLPPTLNFFGICAFSLTILFALSKQQLFA